MNPEILKILTLATVNEALTEYLFSEIPAFEKHIKRLAMVVGILVALLFQADLFPILGLEPIYPIASTILTGVLISRGSNVLNNLIDIVKRVKNI